MAAEHQSHGLVVTACVLSTPADNIRVMIIVWRMRGMMSEGDVKL